MHASSDLPFPYEQFQHLPKLYYPHDALRDSLVRTNIVNLDLASPLPPQRTNPRSHPLTPPDTPGVRLNAAIHVHYDEDDEKNDDLSGQDQGLKRSTLDRFLALGLLVNKKRNPTRYLVVGGVPPTAPTPMLSRVFCIMGALKGMFVHYQQQGIIVLSWHDLRDAKMARTLITTNALFNMDEPLSAAFITPSNLIKSTGQSLFVNPKEGNIAITAEQPAIPSTDEGRKPGGSNQDGDQKHQEQPQQHPISLHAALALFGELSTFSVNESVGSTTYFASYYDAREAANAAKSLHGRSILGMFIRVAEGFPQDTASDNQGGQLHYEDGGSTAMQFNGSGNGNGPPRQHPPTLGPSAYIHGLDDTSQPSHRIPYAYSPPQKFGPTPGVGHGFSSSNSNNAAPDSANNDGPTSSSHSHHHPSPHSRKHTLSTSTSTNVSFSTSTGTGPSTIDSTGPPTPLHAYGRSPALSTRTLFDHGHIRGGGHHPHPHPHTGAGAQELRGQAETVEVVERKDTSLGDNDGATSGPAVPMRPQYNGGGGYHGHAAPERNSVDVGMIEAGLDTRTTVMIKNVPNKMSDADLINYISGVVPNSFDFVYLRFDFNSSANVGYAFVNFVNVADLLCFAKAKLCVKWNMFYSKKILQMSYANLQGKKALVEKFKNSCVMEMRDEWVPKIFHSSGPNKGQREPFPPATNPSRARRSQDRRERDLLSVSGLFVGGRDI